MTAYQALADYVCERLEDFYDPQLRSVDAIGLTQAAIVELQTEWPYYEVLRVVQGILRQAALDYQTEGERDERQSV
jgi:hypothetical protein